MCFCHGSDPSIALSAIGFEGPYYIRGSGGSTYKDMIAGRNHVPPNERIYSAKIPFLRPNGIGSTRNVTPNRRSYKPSQVAEISQKKARIATLPLPRLSPS
jgi:hypothetical protein